MLRLVAKRLSSLSRSPRFGSAMLSTDSSNGGNVARAAAPSSATSSTSPQRATATAFDKSTSTNTKKFENIPQFVRDTLEGRDPHAAIISVLEYREREGVFVERAIEKLDLIRTTDVPPRDLRKVLSTSERRMISGIHARKNCIILHLEHVKAVILKDRMFLFSPHDAKVSFFAQVLPMLVHQPPNSKSPVPFEFRVMEQILIEVTESVDSYLKTLTPKFHKLLQELVAWQSPGNLSALVEAQDILSSFEGRVHSMKNALMEILHNDEDLAKLYLSEKRQTQDHEEVETLLENYLMQVEETLERINELQQRFQNMTSFVQIHFDSQRNVLMRQNYIVTLAMFSTGLMSCGASLFGMNLSSGLERVPHSFYYVSTFLVSTSTIMMGACYYYYLRSKHVGVNLRAIAEIKSAEAAKRRAKQKQLEDAGVEVDALGKFFNKQ